MTITQLSAKRAHSGSNAMVSIHEGTSVDIFYILLVFVQSQKGSHFEISRATSTQPGVSSLKTSTNAHDLSSLFIPFDYRHISAVVVKALG